jgi:hypothetical protein
MSDGSVGHFDHLQHWVPDLAAGVAAYNQLGFPITPGGRHPGRGTHNAQWESRPHFIELIAVVDRREATQGWGPAWPQIEKLLETGGGASRFGVEVDDLPPVVARLRRAGVAVRDPLIGTVAHPDGTTGSWSLAPLTGAPPWAPFFTNYGSTPVERLRGRERAPSPWRITALQIETTEPLVSSRWMAQVLNARADVREGAPMVRFGDVTFAFVAGGRERIVEIVLDGPDPPTGEIHGLRYRAELVDQHTT